MSQITVHMTPDKITKNKVRFQEPTSITPLILDTLYVPKTTLANLEWSEAKSLYVTLATEEDPSLTVRPEPLTYLESNELELIKYAMEVLQEATSNRYSFKQDYGDIIDDLILRIQAIEEEQS